MQIRDSIALVTGAGSGLGQATVDMLVAGGARVAAIDVARPTAAPQDAPDARGVLWLEADVSNAEAMEAAFARVTATWGVPTVLVNCAGVLGPARVFRTDSATGRVLPRDLESFRRVIDINLVGTFNAVRLFAAGLSTTQPAMQPATHAPSGPADAPLPSGADGAGDDEALLVERGVIINTASVAAFEALSGQAGYGASKAGVASMTLPLARELARWGIRVLAVAPGTFATGMYLHIPEHTRRTLVADVPFPRRAGQPDEFAHLVRALIENPMMNGTGVRIDGGVRMREPARPAAAAATSAAAAPSAGVHR